MKKGDIVVRRIISILVSVVMVVAFSAILGGCTTPPTPPADPTPPPAETPTSSIPDSTIISVADLKAALDNGEDVIVIGTVDPVKALVPLSTESKNIDGAFLIWRPDYVGADSQFAVDPQVGEMRKSQADMEDLLSRAGVEQDSVIVVYSAVSMHDAARVVWQLKLLGLNAHYLDGGIDAWIAAGYETGNAVRMTEQDKKTDFKATQYSTDNVATLEMVKEALAKPNEWVVIDTRSPEEYAGEQTSSSKLAYGTGRIMGAEHINWSSNVVKDTNLLKSKDDLEKLYGDMIKGKKVIVYCQSGVRSSHTLMVLNEILGATDVYNYDGSWIEWSFAASELSGNDKWGILALTDVWTDYKEKIS